MPDDPTIKIAPSILAADFLNIGDEIRTIERAGAHMLHIDVMDGKFVPNISVGIPVVESIRKFTKMPLDVHLMISEPVRYVKAFAQAGADIITVHAEACSDIYETINEIKRCNCLCGVSIKPGTEVNKVFPLLNKIDQILIMTVEPGFGGQEYIKNSNARIKAVYDYIKAGGLKVDIEVDGGINKNTIKEAAAAGANVFVAGTSVFRSPDPENEVRELIKAATT